MGRLFEKGNQFGKRKRKAGPEKLAERVRKITKNGRLIQDAALEVMKDPKSKPIERLKAAEFLKETGWGLASRGGDAEAGGQRILINVVYYSRSPKAQEVPDPQKGDPNQGGPTPPPSDAELAADQDRAGEAPEG